MSQQLRFASLLSLVALAACYAVTSTPRPGAVSVPPKGDRCTIEFWSGPGRPQRAMDELADVKVTTPMVPVGVDLKEWLRDKACAAGADAIVDLHEENGPHGISLVGTAVRYRPE